MKIKKIAALCLSTMLATTLLAGCGSKSESGDAGEGVVQAERLDVLKHLGPYDQFDVNADPTVALLEELTGQKVEYTFLPAEQANEKLNLEIAAETQYNTIKLYRNQYDILLGKNMLLDLKPYLEEHGKNILAAIDQKSWDSVTVDGKIYGIPEKNASDNVNTAIIVRKDILDKHGLKVPTTTDEFYEVCKVLKEKGLMVPASIDQKVSPGIAGAFGITNEWNGEKGELVYRGQDPKFKDYLDYMNKLYSEGLLGQDWATLDKNTSKERFINGDTAFMVAAWWDGKGIFDAMKTQAGVEKPEEAIAFIPTLVGPNGEYGVPRDGKIGFVTSIPRYMEKYAVQTIQWMDKKLEAENFKKFTIGDEGYHYTVEDGKYIPNLDLNEDGKAKFDEKNNSSWYLTGTREEEYATYWQARARKTPENYYWWDSMNKENEKYGVYDALGFAPNIESLSVNRQVLDTVVNDFVVKYIAGQTTDFDGYVKELQAKEIDKITTDVNEALK